MGLNLDFAGVEAFIKARMGKVIDMDGCVGAINTFIVEPFVPHDQEYYLCMQARALLTVSAAECTPTARPPLQRICFPDQQPASIQPRATPAKNFTRCPAWDCSGACEQRPGVGGRP